jgi:uncharacterized protein
VNRALMRSNNTRRTRTLVAALLISPALFGCRSSESDQVDTTTPVMAFNTARLRLVAGNDTIPVVAQLAERADQRTMGLMERRHLADTAGMLFIYDSTQPDSSAFWMYRTRIPLDIAFVDSAGVIRSIRHMVPCPSTLIEGCPSYPAGAAYRAALEVNAGYFARHKIDVGSKILLADTAQRVGQPEAR